MPRRSAVEAEKTKQHILDRGVEHASAKGLEGITVGTLALSLGMSKAGVIGPFGSRADLQVEVLDRAVTMFTEDVIAPVLSVGSGLPRLLTLIDRWCEYLDDSPFPNGCFITAASCELDGQPGPLRQFLHDVVVRWRTLVRDQIIIAQSQGALSDDADPDDLVSTLMGISMAANQEIQLLGDTAAVERARRLMRTAVGAGQAR